LITLEISLRLFLGLGNPPLYEPSDEYGYRLIPNQDIRRFGRHIYYNSQGLRSPEISVLPEKDTVRILCIGDSITNGGSLIDQEATYPYQLQRLLNMKGKSCFEVLNASADSWAIENIYSYIRHFGIYKSRFVIIQIGTDDLFQDKSGPGATGTLRGHPCKKPLLAVQELFGRYLVRYLPALKGAAPPAKRKAAQDFSINKAKQNISILKATIRLVRDSGAEPILVMVERPIKATRPKSPLSVKAEDMFAEAASVWGICYLNPADEFKNIWDKSLFLDDVHPNTAGYRLIAESLSDIITKKVGI
jgi:lysophospholipase L1-like esterase